MFWLVQCYNKAKIDISYQDLNYPFSMGCRKSN